MTDGSGVSRILARGVLKVRPHTKRNVGGGGGGGGGCNSLHVRYEKWGGGGGEGGQSASGPIPLFGTQLSLIINSYNFDRGGCSSTQSTPHPPLDTPLDGMAIREAKRLKTE